MQINAKEVEINFNNGEDYNLKAGDRAMIVDLTDGFVRVWKNGGDGSHIWPAYTIKKIHII